MARTPIIAGNWKMNNTYAEAVVLAQEISYRIEKDWTDHVDVIVCPPTIDLKGVVNVFDFDHSQISVGAQNVCANPDGAFTGETSVRMISEIGCKYCIIGHSERRGYYGETNQDVNLKAKALIAGRITPIICVGESLAIRDDNSYVEYICAQVKAAFAGIDEVDAAKCVIAYEPIWAIGTGRTATPEQAEEVCAAIRATVAEMYNAEVAEGMRILYGGSMNPGNVDMLVAEADIDGGLIGGAALKADSFADLVKACL